MSVSVADEQAMESLGRRLGEVLQPDDAVCLSGALGAGKTTLTRGIARGLGVTESVASPTFVIARRSRGLRADLLHCDVYRLSSPAEFEDLAIDPSGAVTVVEWGQSSMPLITDSWLDVTIARSQGEGDETRTVTVRGIGSRWQGAAWTAAAAVVCP